jgi:hypothetical protein
MVQAICNVLLTGRYDRLRCPGRNHFITRTNDVLGVYIYHMVKWSN